MIKKIFLKSGSVIQIPTCYAEVFDLEVLSLNFSGRAVSRYRLKRI